MKIERHKTQLYLTPEEWDTLDKTKSLCQAISREAYNNDSEDELEIYNTARAIATEIQILTGIAKGNIQWL